MLASLQRPLGKPATAAEATAAPERIRVFVRTRPLTGEEIKGKDSIAASVNSGSSEVTLASRVKDAPSKDYYFDGVFTENSDQKHVYDSVVAPAVKSALEGYNCTVFAYGQTGTGKTFTMEGGLEGGAAWSADHPESGMIPRAVRDVFSHLEGNMDAENSVRVSHMELFNEELIDLLGCSDDKPLRLFEHPKDGVTVQNLEQVPVTSADAIFKILRKSSIKRQEAATRLNASSSRSHCIFTITVHSKEATGDGGELIRIGRLNLIDLAGSENVAKSGTFQGEQKREAGVINQSLLVLGRVLTALVENRPHVPYRESKLTRIMADAIGGKTRTSMIACITQAASSYDETQATLEYAAAARKIKNKPEQNAKITKKAVLKEYVNEIERLKAQVTAAREKNGVYLAPEEFKQMQDQLKGTQEQVVRLEEQLTARSRQLDDVTTMYGTTTERLRETSETLQATDGELQETKSALVETQATLEHTQDSLEEHGAVLRHREATEAKLHSNASAILATLDVRERDVEGLHGKVARKAAVEEENKAISASFREYVAGKVQEMDGQLKRFRGTQAEQFASVKGTVHTFMEEKTADMDKLCEKLDALQALLQDTQGRLSAAVSTHADETATDLASLQQTATAGRSAVNDTLAHFVGSAGAAIDEWRAQLAEQRNAVTEWGVNTAASIALALDANDEWSAAHASDLMSLRAALDANTKASLAWADEHRRTIEGALKAHKERTERMQRDMFRQISDLVSGYVVAQQKGLATNVAALQDSTTQQARTLSAHHEARAKTVDAVLIPSVEARTKKLHGEVATLAETVNARVAAETKRTAKDETRAERWTGGVESVCSTLTSLHSDAAVRMAADVDTASESFDSANAAQRAKLDEMAAQTSAWRDEAIELEMVSRASIEETQMAVEAKIRALETHTSKYGEGLQSEMSGVQDQFFHYFDSLREDAPTGETPQKRVVPHPTALPRALPDDEIVAEYVRNKGGRTSQKRMSMPPSPNGFSEFANATSEESSKFGSEMTPTQPTRSQPSTASKTATTDQRKPAPTGTAHKAPQQSQSQQQPQSAAVDPLADKKAAVKAQRQQQEQSKSGVVAAATTAKQSLKAATLGGPQRAALAPINRQNSK